MAAITWLHLSDLHFRTGEVQKWDEDVVLRALLEDVRQQAREGLTPDLILVSGDIAFSGQPAEYKLAATFFDDLLIATGVQRECLLLVPGNHDVDRKRISVTAKLMAGNLSGRDALNEVLGDKTARRAFLERFKGYAAFVKKYQGGAPFDDDHYFRVHRRKVAGCDVAVLALNSAWLAQGGDEDRHKLALGERQVRAAIDAARDADLRIALLHHPFDWLHDFDRVDAEALLCRECDFVLHGHMHQVGLLQARTPDSDAFVVAAGACYETREYPNAYNYVRLDRATGQGSVHLRTYSDRSGGFWTSDTLNYRGVQDGVYRFSLGAGGRAPEAGGGLVPGESPAVQASGGGAAAAGGGVAQTGSGNVAVTGNVQGGVSIYVGSPPTTPAIPSAKGAPVDTDGYDLGVMRDLLLAAFTAADLRRVFLYTSNRDLQTLTREFSPSDGLTAMVERTIAFCLEYHLLAQLEKEIKQANPRQYGRFAGRLRSAK